jgi:hypothetical protein
MGVPTAIGESYLFIDTPTTLQFWSDRVPRVRILLLRQHACGRHSLCSLVEPLKPGNSAIFRRVAVHLARPGLTLSDGHLSP